MRHIHIEHYFDIGQFRASTPNPPLPYREDEPDGPLVALPCADPTQTPAVLRQLWAMVLVMAIRDRAASVHYHPWRPRGGLSYVVDDTRHEIVPPPDEFAGPVLATARELFLGESRGSAALVKAAGVGRAILAGRTCGTPTARCSTVTLHLGGNEAVCEVVYWSTGERAGVEVYFVS